MRYLLNKQELLILNDILSVNESKESIIEKVKKYAKKGLLTASLVTALLASGNLSAQEKQEVKQIAMETTNKKPMFGTPEQRAAAKAKREENRKILQDQFIKGAIIAGFYEVITDEEYNKGVQEEAANTDEYKDIVYREMKDDGTKVKVNLKKYRKHIEKMGKQPDAGLEGMQDPSFTSTSCGISKAHAKEDKKEWSKK